MKFKRFLFVCFACFFVCGLHAVDLHEYATGQLQSAKSDVNSETAEQLFQEAKSLFPEENWSDFDGLSMDEKLAYVRGLLAIKAFEALRMAWFNDFVEESKKRNMEIWESEGSEFSAVFVLVNDEAKKYYLENDYPGAEYHCENVCYDGEFAVAYYDGCKKADKICENVTQIPDDWEEIWFQEEFGTNVDDLVMADARSVIYVKDSVLNNTRTVYSAFVQQDSGLLLDQGARSNVVSAILSVEKEVKSLSEARRLKNTERKEVKQGKRRDALMHNGFYTKKWSPVDVGGKVDMRVYDFISQTDISGSI